MYPTLFNRQERRNELARETKRHELTHKSSHVRQNEGHDNVTRMVITKARAMTFGLDGKLKLLFIRNALFSLFILLELHRSGIERPQSGISGILTGRPPVGM